MLCLIELNKYEYPLFSILQWNEIQAQGVNENIKK
jgi:hypothetical protein